MTVVQAGSINTAALVVPDLVVQVIPPSVQLINGAPTNAIGVVGIAAWGPVGVVVPLSDYQGYVRAFGQLQARSYDMGTQVAAAILQGANQFRCVRATDGTDAAASASVQTNCLTLTAAYTGSLGNSISVAIAPGTAASSYKATVTLPNVGTVPEVFDNITGTGNALWVAIASAINNGLSSLRGPSQLVTATAGAGTTTPTTTTYALSGGTDGASTISASTIVGSDSTPRKGMYALRGTGAQILLLADMTDSTQWSTISSFALFEGMYAVLAGAAGQTISAAVSAKTTAGLDSYAVKVLLGDYVLWVDNVTGQQRYVSPAPFIAGRLGNLAPNQSSLNKPLYGVAGTQRTATGAPYSSAELTTLAQAGIDVIALPSVGGAYYSARIGRNSSSNAVIRGDNYTRMTNFLATTINQGMGYAIGRPNTADTRRGVKVTLDSFFASLRQQGLIDGWQILCDDSNNLPARVALGYMQADCRVAYQSITDYLLANLEGGQSVQITRQPLAG